MTNSNGNNEKNRIEEGTLYLTATPIGNLADISERAIKVLSEVDFICAEDTRNTGKLLNVLGIKKPMISYHEHNKKQKSNEIINRLQAGESAALVTDAGTPAVSDPGADIAAECMGANISVTSVPGPCAAINALILSGMDTSRFSFEGFLPVQKKEKRARLEELMPYKGTLILYEAPHKLKTTLCDLREALGNRRIALCREMTKLNEEVTRCTLDEAVAYFEANDPRGEFVLVLEGACGEQQDSFWQEMSIEEHIEFYISQGISKMDAIKQTARDRGVSKNEIYKQTI